jgi:hypothetical protein
MAKKDAATKDAPADAPATVVEYKEEMSVPFDIEEVSSLKIGQEVVITIRGCIDRLEGSPFFSSIGVRVEEKKLRKTGNSQAEGIRALSGDDGEGDY